VLARRAQVHGYVGNKSAVFPMQTLGLEVDFVNSVQARIPAPRVCLRACLLGARGRGPPRACAARVPALPALPLQAPCAASTACAIHASLRLASVCVCVCAAVFKPHGLPVLFGTPALSMPSPLTLACVRVCVHACVCVCMRALLLGTAARATATAFFFPKSFPCRLLY